MMLFPLVSLLLPVASAKRAPPVYNESMARLALDFAAAAYSNDTSGCLAQHNATQLVRVTVPCDSLHNECWAVLSVSPTMLVVAFRGTQTKAQLIVELVETMSEPKKKVRPGGSIQHYFFVAWKSVWAPIKMELERQLELTPRKPVLFCGHSLGGALASVAAHFFAFQAEKLNATISLYTFGEPRVGNLEFGEALRSRVPDAWRLVHRFDLVAHIPYCYEGLLRRSCTPLFNHGPWHHTTEVWYQTNMTTGSTYSICDGQPLGEDSSCSNSGYLHYNIADHHVYFEVDVSKYGSRGCAVRKRP